MLLRLPFERMMTMTELMFLIAGVTAITTIWLFFLVHAVQHISDPTERALWVIGFLFFTVLCIPVYIYKRYRQFYRDGRGSLIR